MLTSIYNYYRNTVEFIKDEINYFLSDKPEKGLIESNLFLWTEHVFFSCLGYFLFRNDDWFYDITSMWGENLNLKIGFYYTLYTTRYIVQSVMMTGKEKDYKSMMLHHISTILLLTVSFVHYHRIGVIIAFSHDMVDLFFLPAKMFHKSYEVRKIEILNIASYIFFSIFFCIFFATRTLLNSKIILHIIDKQVYTGGQLILFSENERNFYIEGYFLFGLLFVNLGIQIYWQILVIKFAYNLAIGEKPKDEKGNEYFKKEY